MSKSLYIYPTELTVVADMGEVYLLQVPAFYEEYDAIGEYADGAEAEFDYRLQKIANKQVATVDRINTTYNACKGIPTDALNSDWLQRVVKFLYGMGKNGEGYKEADRLLEEIGYHKEDHNE